MLRKILLVGLGFYLGYKFADGVEVDVTKREPTLDEVMLQLFSEGDSKEAEVTVE